MKRIISLCCVCLTLLMSLAVPVKATGFDNSSNWIELLDYGTANNSGENGFSFSRAYNVSYELPKSLPLGYFDLIFYSNRPLSGITLHNSTSMTILDLGNSYYRAYGSLPSGTRSWTVNFTFTPINSSATTRVTIISLKMHTVPFVNTDIPATCQIVSDAINDTIHYNPSDDINYRIFTAPNDINLLGFCCYINVPDWKKYDYIDFQFLFNCFSITSIDAIIGSLNLPLTVSDFSSSNLGNNYYFVSFRLDLTGVDRTTTDDPMITIMGQFDPGRSNSIDFANCSGLVVADDYNPVLWYLSFIWNSIYEYFYDLDSWISDQTEAIQIEIQDAVTSISMEFTNLKSNIELNFSNLVFSLSDWFSSLETQLETITTRIVEAVRGETVQGENFQEEVNKRDDELEDMAAVMDSVEMPDIDSIDVNIDQFVDPVDVQILASPLTVFLEADLFRTMIIMSILLATVSYALYGKR